MDKQKVLRNLLEWADRNNKYIDYYHGIAELGYTDKQMICSNWNPPEMKKISKWVESYFDDLEIDWSDEWMSCSECGKAIRSQPDSYGWLPSYLWTSDCSICCVECFEDCQDDIIQEYTNQTNKAITPEFYPILEKQGFICYSPDEYCKCFETGFHPGQNDDPKKVAKEIKTELPNYDYIFKLDSAGQFDIQWSVFLRKQD